LQDFSKLANSDCDYQIDIQNMKQLLFFSLFILTFYKCFSQTNDTFQYSVPIKYHYPDKKIVTVLPKDTTYFCIRLDNNKNLSVKFKKSWEHLSDTKQLENVVGKYKQIIDSDKILLIAPAKTNYNDFRSIIDVLKKYNYFNFHLIPRG
jgi:biopolymer transport protein ExbD